MSDPLKQTPAYELDRDTLPRWWLENALARTAALEAEIERLELEVAAWKQSSGLKVLEIERLRANADSMWEDVKAADEENKKLHKQNKRLRAAILTCSGSCGFALDGEKG